MHLFIGYKNYSSWSLRPWLALKVSQIEFEETIIPFQHDNSLLELSKEYKIPTKVPFLIDDNNTIWDSLSILEYIAEKYPSKNLWPSDTTLRSMARSASAEMHSSFIALRSNFSMDIRKKTNSIPNEDVKLDLLRLAQLWNNFSRYKKSGGKFLCGHFSNVDAMFAPVMWRVINNNLHVSEDFNNWCKAMLDLPAMQEWTSAALSESNKWVL
ncbi:glutathione S-transferase [Thiofilum flexile]|uniref:glutathione S-transferase n=1 Tax=Thiofilum flexile TaxID=125627 RepID=UPI000382AD20|nr:glutathione S-transferase [Thiofilum flexile]